VGWALLGFVLVAFGVQFVHQCSFGEPNRNTYGSTIEITNVYQAESFSICFTSYVKAIVVTSVSSSELVSHALAAIFQALTKSNGVKPDEIAVKIAAYDANKNAFQTTNVQAHQATINVTHVYWTNI